MLATWKEAGTDNISLIAAGVAFYAFLALVPVLAAVVLTYGLVASPETVIRNVRSLTEAMPADAARLIGGQLMEVVGTSGGKKGLGLFIALALAIWGARNAASAIVTALNVAFETTEKRGFIALTLLSIAMTAIAVLVAVVAGAATAVLTLVSSVIPAEWLVAGAISTILSYAVLFLTSATGAAALFYVGPYRSDRRWKWLSPGTVLFAVAWLALTVGFGFYVANFGNYGATYGSLSAIVVLLTWFYFSAYLLLLGAELNGAFERIAGPPAPPPADADDAAPAAIGNDASRPRPNDARGQQGERTIALAALVASAAGWFALRARRA